MKILIVLLLASYLEACSHGHCRHLRDAEAAKKAAEVGPPVENSLVPQINIKTSSADRIRVYKFDGSLQCGLGHSQSLSATRNQLIGIQVYQSWKRHDGMMRIQLCGNPTGQSNVYEIDRKDLEAALKLGFKEWTVD